MGIKELFSSQSAPRSKRGRHGSGSVTLVFERFQFQQSPSIRADMYSMLGALVADGKPIDAAVRELRDRYKEKKRFLAKTLSVWMRRIDEGRPLSEAIKGYASDTEATILAASDKGGDLAGGFRQAGAVATATAEMRSTVIDELRGPAIQIGILIFMLISFSTSMAPQLTQSVPMAAMDDGQKALFGLAKVIAASWMYVLPALFVFGYFVSWTVPRYSGSFRPVLDKIPPYSIYKIYTSATFMISLSALIRSGVPIESSIRFIMQQSSPLVKSHLSIMVGRMRSGVEQGKAMDTGMLSDRISDMVAIYSTTANFDVAISSMGERATEDGVKVIKKQAGFIKMVSIILIGVLVGWIMLSVMGIGDAAQRASDMSQQGVQAGAAK